MAARASRNATQLPESGTVTVACKLPNGLRLRIFQMQEGTEPVLGGGSRKVEKAVAIPDLEVVLNGTAVPFGKAPEHRIVGGYALTENVDAQFWAKWLDQNKDADYVKNNCVFAYERTNDAAAAAKEQRKVRSGMEPMLQKDDPRRPKSLNPQISDIAKAELTE